MNLSAFFSGLGKKLVLVSKFILKRIPDTHIDVAVGIIKTAAVKFIDNAARREWAVDQLVSELGVSESLARWLVETAVLQVKAETEELIDKAADAVVKAADKTE